MAVTSEELDHSGALVYPSRIKLPYTWHAGKVGSRFYQGLKEHRILGTRCAHCDWVYLPPRETCPKCFKELEEWVDAGTIGKVESYTIIRYCVPGIQPLEPPYALGIIKLEGASSGLVHLIAEIEPQNIEIGMKVEAVFRDDPQGNYLDIRYFRPARGPKAKSK